jgi:hypothetical protein
MYTQAFLLIGYLDVLAGTEISFFITPGVRAK